MSDAPKSFLTASSRLTGFSTPELQGSGMTQTYWDTLVTHFGEAETQELVGKLAEATDDQERLLQRAQDSPRTRTFMIVVAHLWYTGAWPALPKERGHVPESVKGPFIVSAEATRQGMVWYAFGGHAPGANPQGHGSWHWDPWPIPREDELNLEIGS